MSNITCPYSPFFFVNENDRESNSIMTGSSTCDLAVDDDDIKATMMEGSHLRGNVSKAI